MARSGRLTWWAGLLLAVTAVSAAATTMAMGRHHGAALVTDVAGQGRHDEVSSIQVTSKTHDHGHGTQAGATAGTGHAHGDGPSGSAGAGGAPAGDDDDGLVVLDEDVPDDGSGGDATTGDDSSGAVVSDDEVPPDSGSGADGAGADGDEAGGLVVLDDEIPPDDGSASDADDPVTEEEGAAGDDGLIVLDGEVPDDSSGDDAGAPVGAHDDVAHSDGDGEGPAEAASDDGDGQAPHGDDSHGDDSHGDDSHGDDSHSDSGSHSGGGHGGDGVHDGHSAPAPRLSTCVLPGAPGGPRNYSRCMALPGQVPMELYWDVDEAAGTLTAAFVARSIGWAAFGWNVATEADQMLSGDAGNPNLAIVGMTTTDNQTSVGVYALRAKRSAGVQPVATGVYTNLSVTRNEGGALVVGFTRPLAGSRGAPPVPLDGTPVNGIWSTGAPPSSPTALEKHVVHGLGAIDFTRSDTDAAPADGSDDESACFPSSARVMSPSRGSIRMDALRVGDAVAAGVGGVVVSDVYLFTHADPATRSRFVVLTTVVSPGHYVHLADGRTAAARTVRVGDALVDASTGGAAPVTAVSAVVAAGLYNPQTLNGELVVDGYAVSTYTTAVNPAVAAAALAPVRALLAALLPSGRDSL
ncbi:hypothetical protein MMPV_010079 [Pyropia vietnamensis]